MYRQNKHPSPGMGRMPALAPLANAYVPYQMEHPEKYEARSGLVRGTLYPGLDFPFMGMVNKKTLPVNVMSDLQSLKFAVQELGLYLDTHREDADALALYRKYQQLYNEKEKEYLQKRGPLSRKDIMHDSEYLWISDPWPWEYCANKEG